ncbi:MAG: dienelactone hydrolase family protein [Chloroflexi bacterium]|nr:dienelactone hydrolase family protein [Chloroflexota bacterium]
MNQEENVKHLIGEWEHGAMNRREFFERALFLLGSATAAEALLAACSPAAAPAATALPSVAPAATATAVPTVAPTVAPTRPPQPTNPPPLPPVTSRIPGFVDASAVDTSQVTYSSGDVKMMAYLAKPKSGGPWPGVIVIHENRGLTDHIKDVTRRIANLGYAALGVDLLSRLGGTPKFDPPADPTQAINSLKQEDVNADLVASAAFLKAQSFVKPKLGSVGFCWGGHNSIQAAIRSKDVVACVIFYGRNPSPIDDIQQIAGATIGNYGDQDQGITPGVPALDAAMKKYNKPFEYKIYPGANHAFFNDTGPRFHEASAKDAWARLVDFYKKQLA